MGCCEDKDIGTVGIDSSSDDGRMQETVKGILEFIGEDASRDGLLNTPARVRKSWASLYVGYTQDPKDIFTFFEKDSYDGLVVLKDCEFVSMCEHHMLPFYGKATVAYLPGSKVIGISKLARLLDIYARRLQNQERICEQVTDALMNYGGAKGAACVIEAKHMCMVARGVSKQMSSMVTSSLKGVCKTDAALRNEVLYLIKG